MNTKYFRNVIMGSLLMMVTIFVATTSAQGQSSSDYFRAKIPFDFVVGSKKLPAGNTEITRRTRRRAESPSLGASGGREQRNR